jgi:hypothetical protein
MQHPTIAREGAVSTLNFLPRVDVCRGAKIREDKIIQFFLQMFANVAHAMSTLVACVMCLGFRMDHLLRFKNLEERFDSLGT